MGEGRGTRARHHRLSVEPRIQSQVTWLLGQDRLSPGLHDLWSSGHWFSRLKREALLTLREAPCSGRLCVHGPRKQVPASEPEISVR